MSRQELLKTLRERFPDEILGVFEKSPKRVYIQIQPDAIVRLAQYLFTEMRARFNIASGVDGRNQMEILYHFYRGGNESRNLAEGDLTEDKVGNRFLDLRLYRRSMDRT